jgi:molecular chaperone DnaK
LGAINSAKEELSEALKGSDIDDIEAKTKTLTELVYAVTTKLYQAQAPGEEEAGGGDATIDADYDIKD